jgi:hypothetical protein
MSLGWATFWVGLVGSLATVAALVTAILLGVHEVRALRRENAERDTMRRQEHARRRRAQAECVSARLKVEREPSRYQADSSHFAFAEVFNASALPIYDVEVCVTHAHHPGQVSKDRIAFVAGGQTGHVHTPVQPDTRLDDQPIDVRFRDAAGLSWVRHRDGRLHELIGSVPAELGSECDSESDAYAAERLSP